MNSLAAHSFFVVSLFSSVAALAAYLFAFRRSRPQPLSQWQPRSHAQPKTHDFTYQKWGHGCAWASFEDNSTRVDLSGSGRGLAAQDFVLLPDGTRYKLDTVAYASGTEMWFATATLAPRDRSELDRDEALRRRRPSPVSGHTRTD